MAQVKRYSLELGMQTEKLNKRYVGRTDATNRKAAMPKTIIELVADIDSSIMGLDDDSPIEKLGDIADFIHNVRELCQRLKDINSSWRSNS